jgi:hypothetical protein
MQTRDHIAGSAVTGAPGPRVFTPYARAYSLHFSSLATRQRPNNVSPLHLDAGLWDQWPQDTSILRHFLPTVREELFYDS